MMNPIKLYYCANWLYRHKIPVLPTVIQQTLFFIFKAVVPYKTKIGKNCRLAHGGNGVVIHQDVKIGDNVLICHQVTIGGRGYLARLPIIGSDVYIGPGAKILGPVTIGDNCVIGANAVVSRNIPSNCVASGFPAQILKRNIDAHKIENW
jgi:serine O-acetyltransferase